FPRTQSNFYLLSTVNIAVALTGVWTLAGLFLDKRGRWAAVLFLVLTPSFSVWALRFNANAPLLSTWPWLTYFFLQSLQTRRLSFAIGAGAVGALALLTKYYALALFGTLFLVALLHPERRRYFRSPAPYVTAAVGLLLVTPHVYWTVASGFPTVEYAVSKTHYSVADARSHVITSASVSLGLLGVPLSALLASIGGASRRGIGRSKGANLNRDKAWLVCLALGPFVLTILTYFAFNARITSGFLIPAFFAFPVVALVLSGIVLTRIALRRFAICAAAIWLPVAVVSPLLGAHALGDKQKTRIEPREAVAAAATDYWRAAYGRPLRIVAGKKRLATAATFYSADAPAYFDSEKPENTPGVSSRDVEEEGVLFICPTDHSLCLARANSFAEGAAMRITREFVPHFLGVLAKPQSFTFILHPPKSFR